MAYLIITRYNCELYIYRKYYRQYVISLSSILGWWGKGGGLRNFFLAKKSPPLTPRLPPSPTHFTQTTSPLPQPNIQYFPSFKFLPWGYGVGGGGVLLLMARKQRSYLSYWIITKFYSKSLENFTKIIKKLSSQPKMSTQKNGVPQYPNLVCPA